ncbi:Rad4-domain-containing protein [Patellaria atrata CBS 101060]|uniref:Rad4-domain-containing protein n=1 Tax=Patellaria atrata CBS 101060 TaxID=1346257 RepID=A0A9P4S7D4_9PEZI|nr:Rad4-domain-containing protein [Patellaria atrata CBS 101060]
MIIDSDESEESEFEWEDVGLGKTLEDDKEVDIDPNTSGAPLSIVLGERSQNAGKTPRRIRRRVVTSVEKKMRLDIHKIHILCLLSHVHIRNDWCNDVQVQGIVKQLLPPNVKTFLKPNPRFSQSEASQSFLNGLQRVTKLWKENFQVTALGITKPTWAETEGDLKNFKLPNDHDPPLDRSDFRDAATTLRGSQDVGAQLFCALLRSVGLETRLVCSLQSLTFRVAQASSLDDRYKKPTIFVGDGSDTQVQPLAASTLPTRDVESQDPASSSKLQSEPLRRIQRIGQRRIVKSSNPVKHSKIEKPRSQTRRTFNPRYPVYWVEAFNEARQKWVCADPLATGTVGKPTDLEPPLNSLECSMSYVVAFEDDGVLRDVTRRYAKAYNAKTRKTRVESTAHGQRWWKRAVKRYRKHIILDRDQVEDAELAQREAAESMPRNVQDYKDHPYYVLERHLKHNEVIHPKREVGKVNTGTSNVNKLEPIYRRNDVHVVRSADKWYRFGREVKAGEQPLGHSKPRNGKLQIIAGADDEDENDTGNALYAGFQTELYVPPPIVHGKVPRNVYGNLDVYVPSMIPRGGVHIQASNAAKAARLIGVDYADAVTGFSFKGRQGTAIIQGIVVAAEYKLAVEAVIDGFSSAEQEQQDLRKTSEALRLWRRFMLGLRILERVSGYIEEGEEGNVQDQLDKTKEEEAYGSGGFFASNEPVPQSTTHTVQSPWDFFGSTLPSDIVQTRRARTGKECENEIPVSLNEESYAERTTEATSAILDPPDNETLNPSEDQEDSELERGSLLSHDPEDEDAEPDWLLDSSS